MPVTSIGEVRRTISTSSRPSAASVGGKNDVLKWPIFALLALSPLPLGSNRPLLWTLSALAVGIIGLVYFISLRKSASLRVPLTSVRWPATLFAIFCAYLVVQILPIGALLGLPPVVEIDGVTIARNSLSIAPGSTFLMLLRMLSYGIFFFLVLQITLNERRASMMLDVMLGLIAAYAVYGLFSLQAGDTILGLPKWSYVGSATGPFVNRNSFATFLAIGATIASARSMEALFNPSARAQSRMLLVAYLMIHALLLATVVATQSRMGLFVTVAGTAVPLLLTVGKISRSPVAMLILMVAGLATLAATVGLYGDGLFERVGRVEESSLIRSSLYDQIVAMILANPWIGTGGGTFDLAFPLVHQLPVNPDVVWDRAHNTYLALFSETGIVFGLLPIIIYVIAAMRICRSLIAGKGNWAMQAIALGVLVVGGLHSLVDFSLEIQAVTFYFVAATSLGLAASLGGGRATG